MKYTGNQARDCLFELKVIEEKDKEGGQFVKEYKANNFENIEYLNEKVLDYIYKYFNLIETEEQIDKEQIEKEDYTFARKQLVLKELVEEDKLLKAMVESFTEFEDMKDKEEDRVDIKKGGRVVEINNLEQFLEMNSYGLYAYRYEEDNKEIIKHNNICDKYDLKQGKVKGIK